MRLRLWMAAVCAGLALVGTTAMPAHASDEIGELEVTSARVLKTHAIITVAGANWSPSTAVTVREEGSIPGGYILFNLKTEHTVTAGPDGTFELTMSVPKVFKAPCTGSCAGRLTTKVRTTSCAVNPCYVVGYGVDRHGGTTLDVFSS